MDLSVIIVSYNVKYFLEQCLHSLQKAMRGMQGEVIVVDNHSHDGTPDYIQKRFPSVRFIANTSNPGFAKANNQALAQAKGNYILYLNPDTILPEDCLQKTLAYAQANPKTGALGIRMIDGSGHYLKESKRGFPTAWAAFTKMTGLAGLFPHSKVFAGYYLGHLSSDQNQEADALSGAFMLVRKEILEKAGGFDEQFFMYAEDIDLSYRIQQLGFKNVYFADATIIHFKGESTQKGPAYTRQFYGAMSQFVKKHYGSGLFVSFLETGIRIKEALAKIKGNGPGTSEAQPAKLAFSLKGDPASVNEINYALTVDAGSANIIYCSGESFSYKEIIKNLQDLKPGQRFFVHSAGSNSIVGSGSSKSQGSAFEIKPR